eukprot:GHRR01037396.1.p1 GENE.GHRR01037396.1~~GHRR01037396.1.p1  ORF type:complete len:116 (+),score=14.85 GHRR01037396.1:485-832(+)
MVAAEQCRCICIWDSPIRQVLVLQWSPCRPCMQLYPAGCVPIPAIKKQIQEAHSEHERLPYAASLHWWCTTAKRATYNGVCADLADSHTSLLHAYTCWCMTAWTYINHEKNMEAT